MLGTKFYCFYHFWFLIKICSEFLRKNFGTVIKKQHFTSRDDHTKNEQISRIVQKFWIFLGIRASNLRSLMGKLHARFSKLHSTCTKEQFEKSLMLEKKYYCFITFEIQSKTFGVYAEKFRHGGQKTAFHVKRWSYQEWTNLSNNAEVLIFLEIRSSNLGSLVTTSCTVVRTAFFMYKRTIQKKLDVWKEVYCFYHFWFLIKIFSEFLRKSTARWSKLHSTSTDGPAEKEEQISWITQNFLHFFENSSVKITEIGENFMHGCENCILHVRRNNSRKVWCWGKNLLFLSLLIFNQSFSEFLRESFGTVVKPAFHVYRWSFRERTNLLNNT